MKEEIVDKVLALRKEHQLLTYKDDVDLKEKLNQWENFYNFERPHGAHKGKTPYEALKDR